jgi:hypothetical protein
LPLGLVIVFGLVLAQFSCAFAPVIALFEADMLL